MGYAVKVYATFRDLGEDKAKLLAEVVEYLESQKAATSEELKETELRLSKEIEQTRLEIEQVRKELKETELKLSKEIEQVRKEIKEAKVDFIKWSFLFWVGQIGVIAAFLKLLLR